MDKGKGSLDTKTTMLTISTGFIALYLIFGWKWAIITALVIGIVGIISPFLSSKITYGWMKLTLILSYIVPNILLSIVFFLVLFPMSLLSKIFKKDTLLLSNKYDTYYSNSNRTVEKSSFEKSW
jgi:hypothetical protein